MTKKESKNSAENDNQEIDTGFYGSMVNPRYTSESGTLTADMLTRAAEKARTMGHVVPPQGLMSPKTMQIYAELMEKERMENRFYSSPVGELLK